MFDLPALPAHGTDCTCAIVSHWQVRGRAEIANLYEAMNRRKNLSSSSRDEQ